MKREGNILYFEPQERDRFFHAIRLIGAFKKCDSEKVTELVQHEQAHIDKSRGLGYRECINSFSIKPEKKRVRAYVEFIEDSIPFSDLAKITLAPDKPSFRDLGNGAKLLGYNLLGRINLFYRAVKCDPHNFDLYIHNCLSNQLNEGKSRGF